MNETKKPIKVWDPFLTGYFELPLGMLQIDKIIAGGETAYIVRFPFGKVQKMEATEEAFNALKTDLAPLFSAQQLEDQKLPVVPDDEFADFKLKFDTKFGPKEF